MFIELDQATINRIREDEKARVEKQMAAGMGETQEKGRKALKSLSDGLHKHGKANPDAKPNKNGVKRPHSFKDSTVEGIAALVDALPGLNVTGSKAIDDLTRELSKNLANLDGEELRDNDTLRADAAAKADALLDSLDTSF